MINFSAHPLTHDLKIIASVDENEISEAHKLFSGKNGIIFLANGPDGLRAYTFEDTTFINIAHINDGGSAIGVVQAQDGTVFLANGNDGLRAYSFDGNTFTNKGHINDGGLAMDVALAADGTVFLANGEDGLRAYNYDGTFFEEMTHVDDDEEWESRRVVIHPDGTIFLANFVGFWAYEFTGDTLTRIWNSNEHKGASGGIALGLDSTIFLSEYRSMYSYTKQETSLDKIAQISLYDFWPYGITVTTMNTVFITGKSSPVNGWGVAACSYDGESLIQTAQLNGYDSRDVIALSEDTILVASGRHGIIAYSYSPMSATSINNVSTTFPEQYMLFQNYPNPFNPSTTIEFYLPKSSLVKLKVFDLLGRELATLVDTHKPAGTHTVSFDALQLASGIYYYTLTAGEFKQSRKMLLIR